MKKITLITQPEVVSKTGGAISVFFHLCNMLCDNGYYVSALCYSEDQGRPEKLVDDIHFVNLFHDYPGLSYSKALHRHLKHDTPDLMVFFFHFMYYDAKLGRSFNSIPRILTFHSRPDFYFSLIKHSRLRLWSQYSNTVSTVLFHSYLPLLPSFIRRRGTAVIPNYVIDTNVRADYDISAKKIVFLSRIDKWKGLELLIDAVALLSKRYPDWTVDIYGAADSEKYLNTLIEKTHSLNLENQIRFMGITKTPLDTLSQYDFCVFPSRFEGFPIGLAEAMSVGLPCVGLGSCSGVNEMIVDNVNGFLCEDAPSDVASAMEKLMTSGSLRKQMGLRSREYIQQFSDAVYEQKWLGLISQVLDKKHQRKILPVRELVNM